MNQTSIDKLAEILREAKDNHSQTVGDCRIDESNGAVLDIAQAIAFSFRLDDDFLKACGFFGDSGWL